MTREKLAIEFVRFLVHECVLKKYEMNRKGYRICKEKIHPHDAVTFLINSFPFEYSNEGLLFWNDINIKWLSYLKNRGILKEKC